MPFGRCGGTYTSATDRHDKPVLSITDRDVQYVVLNSSNAMARWVIASCMYIT